MKVLWLLDFLPPVLAQAAGQVPQATGSWAVTLLDAVKSLPGPRPRISVCGFSRQLDSPSHHSIDGIEYTALPLSAGKQGLEILLEEEEPDLVQLFGTGNEFAPWLFELFDPQRILVYLQRLSAPCGEHLADGLPSRFLHTNPLKEQLSRKIGTLTVRQQQEKLFRRGTKEKEILSRACHVLGRTDWDRDYCLSLNPEVRYHQLNEIIRPVFYSGDWRRTRCQSHRIFMNQADFPLKGFHRAIEALPALMARWPDTQLYVSGWPPCVGDPMLRPLTHWLNEYAGYLATLAHRLGVEDRIHYTGTLDQVGIRQQLMTAETFLLPSSIENSPNSLGEAMLMGLPCAAAGVGGVPSMVTEEQAALFDPDEPGALAAAVASLWEDPAAADRMARAARSRALEDHDPVTIARRQLELYDEIALL